MSNPALVNPDLNYALEVFGNALKYDLNCHRVGKIVKFNPDDLTCDVELLELKPNKERLTKYSIIQGLPLLISGGIDTNLTFGDVTGAECLIHFNDRDIDSWFDTGEAYKPNSKRMHDFSDGFVSLQPHNKYDNIDYEVDGTVLHKGSSKIKLTSQGVEVSVGDIPATEEQPAQEGCVFTLVGNTATLKGNLILNGNANINGDVMASGTITGQTDVIAGTISGKNHTHTSASAGNPSSPPNS